MSTTAPSIRDCLQQLQAFDDVVHAATAAEQTLVSLPARDDEVRILRASLAALRQLHTLAHHMGANLRMGSSAAATHAGTRRASSPPRHATQPAAAPPITNARPDELGTWPAPAPVEQLRTCTPPGCIDVDQVARLCHGYSTNWVWQAVARGWLPQPVRRGSSHMRTMWRDAEVTAALSRIDFSGRWPRLRDASTLPPAPPASRAATHQPRHTTA